VGHLQVVNAFRVAIQCMSYVCKVWAGERDLVTIIVTIISFLMYISVVMEYVTVRVLNLSSIFLVMAVISTHF